MAFLNQIAVEWQVRLKFYLHMVLLLYLHIYVFSDLSSKHGIFTTAIQTADISLQKMKTDVIRYMYQITDSEL